MKKIVSVLLIAALIAAVFVPVGAAETAYRGGMSLTPVSYDSTGVMPDSAYVLTGAGAEPQIMINDTITTTVTPNEDGSFLVTPDAPLTYNKLYTFRLEGEEPAVWTFQTAEKFRVESTLPGGMADSVPVNTGIEIAFSHDDFDLEQVKNGFEIKPNVAGSWEKHDKTAVFVPDAPLERAAEYTVKLSKDIVRQNGETLGEVCRFTFTTEGEEEERNSGVYLSAYSNYVETPTDTAPVLAVYAHREDGKDIDIAVKVYAVAAEDAEAHFAEDINMAQLAERRGAELMSFSQKADEDKETYRVTYIDLPRALENGFYLAELSVEDKTERVLIQSTDIGAYITRDNDGYLIWTNNVSSGGPCAGARFSSDGLGEAVSDASGLAWLDAADTYDEEVRLIKAETDGESAVFLVYNYDFYNRENKYFSALEFDRDLYMPDDTLYFWGAVKAIAGEEPKSLIAEVYNNSYYSGGNTPLVTVSADCEDGVFSGSLPLPNLNSGGYVLRIKNGEDVIRSKYFNVDQYQKPDYTLELTADKKAVFIGDSINYSVKTQFFDGTAVSGLDVNFKTENAFFADESETLVTDALGEASIGVAPTLTKDNKSGYHKASYRASAYAKRPELGDISDSTVTEILLNDIGIGVKSEFKDGTSVISLHSDLLTVDKVNGGEGERINGDDYISGPDAGRAIRCELKYNYYEERQTGTGYDYINKKSYPTYAYDEKAVTAASFDLTTDGEGNAEYSFTSDRNEGMGGYYTLDISCADNRGEAYVDNDNYIRTTEHRVSPYSYGYRPDGYDISCDKENYDIGESVNVSVTKGGEPAPDGRFLFLKDCNGIKDAAVATSGAYATVFDGLPGICVNCVVFDPESGYTDIGFAEAEYDTEKSRLSFEISTDKEEYAPGESCEITVKVFGPDGTPAAANVNISVVDEALFELSDYVPNTLEQLYGRFYSTLNEVYSSHQMLKYESPMAAEAAFATGGGGSNDSASSRDAARVRSEFKDTASFISLKTDENGIASASFTLPDNITSWRATVSAVTDDMAAGNDSRAIKVTMPAFISYTMSKTYMAGDSPMIGVSLYGSALGGDEDVVFTAYDGVQYATAQGKPFERMYIPLSMDGTLGLRALIISAEVNGAAVDSVQTAFEVVDTYNMTEQATEYSSPYEPIISQSDRSVKVIFSDESRASLLNDIYYMRYLCGDRLDQRVSMTKALELLNKYYEYECEIPDTDWSAYQSEDGGIKLLPYGESEPELTAMLTPYIEEHIDRDRLCEYLASIEGSAKVLYSRAVLREPVLDEIEAMSAADNLSAVEYLYLALAYCELGELDKAADIFESRVEAAGLIEDYGTMMRIRGGETADTILESTAVGALVALRLGMDSAAKLYGYTAANSTDDILINIERLAYISETADTLPAESGSVSYQLYGQTFETELRGGGCHTVTVPAAFLPEFKVLSASESIRMLSVSRVKMNVDETLSPDVSVERVYSNSASGEITNAFSENDIVKITFNVEFSEAAPDGGYVITDYLPSGLTPILNGRRDTGSFMFYYGGGQQVRLYAYPDKNNKDTCSYYARVTSPGNFTADSAVIQNTHSTNIIAATGKDNVVISN